MLDNIDSLELIGFAAAILTTAAFLPQVYRTWKTKDVSGLSLTMLLVFFIGIMLWLVYGFLKDSPSFKSLNEDERFIKLFGIAASQTNNREEDWVRDINYLEKRINELHYSPNHVISKKALSNEILDIKINVASLSDEQIVVKLMKVVGSLGNGHNLIIPTSPKQNPLKKLPIQFYHFNDGIYIVNTAEGLEQWIGYKVKLIEKTPIKEVLQKTNTLNARDNDMQILWLGPYYMCLPDVLKEIGIISNTNKVTLTLSDVNGKTESLTLTPITWSFNGFPKLPKLKKKKQPLFLSQIEKPYWYKFNPENNSIYIQFNVVSENQRGRSWL